MDHAVHTYKVHNHESREAEGWDIDKVCHRTLALLFDKVICVENLTQRHFHFTT
jgi:hypothetical protein